MSMDSQPLCLFLCSPRFLKALAMSATQDLKQETMVLQQEINLLQKGLR